MILIEKIKELQELKEKISKTNEWTRDDDNYDYLLGNAVPSMLEVLSMFQEGDAKILEDRLSLYRENSESIEIDTLKRLQKAGQLMEEE
jgi:hypothetical protein